MDSHGSHGFNMNLIIIIYKDNKLYNRVQFRFHGFRWFSMASHCFLVGFLLQTAPVEAGWCRGTASAMLNQSEAKSA